MDNFLRIKDKKFNKTFRSETFFSYLQLLNKKRAFKKTKVHVKEQKYAACFFDIFRFVDFVFCYLFINTAFCSFT